MVRDESQVREFMAIYGKCAGYLQRAALCHGGDTQVAGKILEDALWNVFLREGVIYKRPAFRSEVVGEMELLPGGGWPRMEVAGSKAAEVYSALDEKTQRAVTAALEWEWGVKDAAHAAGIDAEDVKEAIDEIREAKGGDTFRRDLHAALIKETPPDNRSAMRALETKMREYREPNPLPGRILRGLVFAVGSVVVCAMIWVLLILWENR